MAKYGGVLLIEGILSFDRADFGLNEGNMLSEIMEKVSVNFTVFGCSDQVRPLLLCVVRSQLGFLKQTINRHPSKSVTQGQTQGVRLIVG